MNLRLQGSHVLVTGASRGIGKACVRAFLDEGATVSALARTEQTLEAMAAQMQAGDRLRVFCADLQDAAQAQEAVRRIEAQGGPIQVLVNCAGAAKRTPFAQLQPADWHAGMQAKFYSYMHVLTPVVQRMAGRGAGAVVNVVGAGGKRANPVHLAGGAANAALMLAGTGLAAAYAPSGVRINTINPGQVRTERLQAQRDAQAAAGGAPLAEPPLGRPAEPEEIAALAVFLASPRASYVSGAVIAMDGVALPTVV